MKKYSWSYAWERKEFLLLFAITIILLCFFTTADNKAACKKAIIAEGSTDTCFVKHQNIWTGNYRLVDSKGAEFSANPMDVLFVCAEYKASN